MHYYKHIMKLQTTSTINDQAKTRKKPFKKSVKGADIPVDLITRFSLVHIDSNRQAQAFRFSRLSLKFSESENWHTRCMANKTNLSYFVFFSQIKLEIKIKVLLAFISL